MRPRAVKSRSGVTARKRQTRIYTWTALLSPHALRHRSQPQCHLAWPTRTPASFLHCLFVRSSLGPANSSGTGCALAQLHVACPWDLFTHGLVLPSYSNFEFFQHSHSNPPTIWHKASIWLCLQFGRWWKIHSFPQVSETLVQWASA